MMQYVYTATNAAGVKKVCASLALAQKHAGDDGFWVCDRIEQDPCEVNGTKIIKLPKAGYTLIELMVVTTIISILGTIAIPAYAGFANEVRERGEVAVQLRALFDAERAVYHASIGSAGLVVSGTPYGGQQGGEVGEVASCYQPHFLYTPNERRYLAGAGSGGCNYLGFNPPEPLYCAYGNYPSWNSDAHGYVYVNYALCDVDGDGDMTAYFELVDLGSDDELRIIARRKVEGLSNHSAFRAAMREMWPQNWGS